MSSVKSSKQDKKKFWTRVICIALCVLMVSSLLAALAGAAV